LIWGPPIENAKLVKQKRILVYRPMPDRKFGKSYAIVGEAMDILFFYGKTGHAFVRELVVTKIEPGFPLASGPNGNEISHVTKFTFHRKSLNHCMSETKALLVELRGKFGTPDEQYFAEV
jgi:hypothetical protein